MKASGLFSSPESRGLSCSEVLQFATYLSLSPRSFLLDIY